MPLRDLFITGVFFGTLLAAFVRPYIALCVWTVFTYAAPHRFTWGFAHDFSFVFIAAAATLFLMVLHRAARVPPLRAPGYMLIALVVWAAVTTLAAYNFDWAIDGYIQSLKIVALGVASAIMVRDRQTFYIVTTCLCASIVFYGVKGGLFVLATGGNYLVFGPPESFMHANNGLGVALLMMLPIAWFLAVESKNKWLRLGWLASIPLSILSVLSTYSRGSVLALGCLGVYWLFVSGRRRLAIGLVALIPFAVFVIMPDQFVERMQTIRSYEQDDSALTRLEMWGFAARLAAAWPLGGGFGISSAYELYQAYGVNMDLVEKPRSFHSIYFEVLGQHGFIGLFLFLGSGLSLYASCGRVMATYSSGTARNFAAAVRLSLVAYAVGGSFVNKAFEWPMTFQLLGLFLAASAIFAEHGHAETQRAEPLGGQPKARGGMGRHQAARRGLVSANQSVKVRHRR